MYKITIYEGDSSEPTRSQEYDTTADMPAGTRLFVEATEEGLIDPAAPPYRWSAEVWASETDGLRVDFLGGDDPMGEW
jgi:hypothetical protein